MSSAHTRIAACGLDCTTCDLYLMVTDETIQFKMLGWFRSQGWLAEGEGMETVLAKGMYCKGCMVDAEAFWSDSCQIGKCCKVEKGLVHCGECHAFACPMLEEHAAQNERYAEGVAYLRQWRKRTTQG